MLQLGSQSSLSLLADAADSGVGFDLYVRVRRCYFRRHIVDNHICSIKACQASEAGSLSVEWRPDRWRWLCRWNRLSPNCKRCTLLPYGHRRRLSVGYIVRPVDAAVG